MNSSYFQRGVCKSLLICFIKLQSTWIHEIMAVAISNPVFPWNWGHHIVDCIFICLHPSLFGTALLTDFCFEKALLWCLIDSGLFIMKAAFDVSLFVLTKFIGVTILPISVTEKNLPLAHVTSSSSCSRAFVDAFAMTMTDKSSPSVLTIDKLLSSSCAKCKL